MSWIGLLLLTVTEVSTTCAVVISRVKVSCIASVDGIILWLLIWLVNYVAMLLVVFQLSRDVIGYEDSQSVIGAFIFLTVENHHKQQENIVRVSLRKQLTFGDATTGFAGKWCQRNERKNSAHTDDMSLPRSWLYFWLDGFSTNQKHCPDLGSDTSSVWNFCANFSDVISRANQGWRCEMWGVSQAKPGSFSTGFVCNAGNLIGIKKILCRKEQRVGTTFIVHWDRCNCSRNE